MPTQRQFEIFLAAAKHGSLGRAADSLQVSQPSVSKQIRALERQLGGQLFQRRRGAPSTLTDFGRVMVGRAQELLNLHQEIGSFGNIPETDAASCEILTRPFLRSELIEQITRLFPDPAKRPNFRVLDESEDILDCIRGRANIFSLFHAMALPTEEDVDFTLLHMEPCGLYAAESKRAELGPALCEVNAVDWVVPARPSRLARWMELMLKACGVAEERILDGPQFMETAFSQVLAQGQGCLLMDRHAEPAVARGELVKLPHPVAPLFLLLGAGRNCDPQLRRELEAVFREI